METSSLITEMFCFPSPQPTEMSESVTNSFRIQKLLADCTKKSLMQKFSWRNCRACGGKSLPNYV